MASERNTQDKRGLKETREAAREGSNFCEVVGVHGDDTEEEEG